MTDPNPGQPARYRRRPADIEAVQWTGHNPDALRAFCGSDFDTIDPEDRIDDPDQDAQLLVEASHWVGIAPTDWVLKFDGYFVAKSDDTFRAVWAPAAVETGVRAALRDRIAAYRAPVTGHLYCAPCGSSDRSTPLTSEDLPDGGICVGCGTDVLIPSEPTDQAAAEPPLSPYYEHPECGFHWHGRDGMDIPMRDGQPVCPRCELRRLADEQHVPSTAPIPLRWGLDDIEHGDDDTVTVLLSGPDGRPYWLELDPDRANALREALSEPDHDADACRSFEVDGQIVSFRGAGEMTEQDRQFAAEVVRAARRRYAAEHPDVPAGPAAPAKEA